MGFWRDTPRPVRGARMSKGMKKRTEVWLGVRIGFTGFREYFWKSNLP